MGIGDGGGGKLVAIRIGKTGGLRVGFWLRKDELVRDGGRRRGV